MTNLAEKYQKAFEIGMPIFNEIFKMSDNDLKDKLKSILKNKIDSRNLDLFEKSSNVRRIILNEEAKEINIEFYDTIKIHPLGIDFQPEHGSSCKLVEFDEHFKL